MVVLSHDLFILIPEVVDLKLIFLSVFVIPGNFREDQDFLQGEFATLYLFHSVDELHFIRLRLNFCEHTLEVCI